MTAHEARRGELAARNFMRRGHVLQELGISRSTLDRMLRSDPTFPRFVPISAGIEVIDRRDFDAWLHAKRTRSRVLKLLGET